MSIEAFTDGFVDDLKVVLKGNDSHLISAMIIYPKDLAHKKLVRKLILKNGVDINEYLNFELNYVGEDKANPRTLTFEKYPEAVKYSFRRGDVNRLSSEEIDYSVHEMGDFEISGISNDISKQQKYWRVWREKVYSSFNYANSTLWSYIVLKKFNQINNSIQNIICSAYLIFSGNIGRKNAILIDKICQDYLYVFTNDHYNFEIEQLANRAAISQVMTRNMSHNIGSHVLSKFKDMSDVESITSINNSAGVGQYKGKLPLPKPKNQKDAVIANFNDYLKSRMDFLADITVATPILETSYKFCSDVISGILKNSILLNRISGIAGDVKYEICIRVWGESQWWKDEIYDDNNNKWNYDTFDVAMPNDILGCHALYVIIENVIRNTYKHSKKDLKEFIFTIDIKPCVIDPDLYEVCFYDNNCKQLNELIPVIEGRNKTFNDEIIKNNKLRSDGLGTIEMEVCAAYLRKISLDNYQSDIYIINEQGFNSDKSGKKVLNIIKAYPQYWNDKCDCASLGYVFYLLKPKEVLVISDQAFKGKKEWEIAGIDGVPALDENKNYAHQILLHQHTLENSISFSPRVVQLSEVEMKSLCDKDALEVIEYAWIKYGELLMKSNNIGYTFHRKSNHTSYPEKKDNNVKIYFEDHAGGTKENEYIEASHHRTRKTEFNEKTTIPQLVSLAEMTKTKVCIIDERIQAFAEYKVYSYDDHSVPFHQYFPHIQVHIPRIDSNTDPNLNVPDFGTLNDQNSVQAKLKTYLEVKSSCDFIIIHLGIVEKMLDIKSKETVNNKILELVGGCNEMYNKIVITSGRGTPDTVPDNCRYLPLTVVQYCVETSFDKFLLVKALYNSRKSK